MSKVRIHILYSFREGPWGGANQFLKALREEIRTHGNWADSPTDADVILFDSFNELQRVIWWKLRLPSKPFVQRIDGPISGYRGKDLHLDKLIHEFSKVVADGVLFQSEYSRRANLSLGMLPPLFSAVVLNAPNSIFRASSNQSIDKRIRIISVSWSSNWNKGFDILDFLDRNLDFSRYKMTFVGNSPVQFRNIEHLPPHPSSALAIKLRQHDIFLAASRYDPCSNALCEALASGLPSVALNSGGHPELVGSGGLLFDSVDDVIDCIETVAEDMDSYRNRINVSNMSFVAKNYLRFMTDVTNSVVKPKKITLVKLCLLEFHLVGRLIWLTRERLVRYGSHFRAKFRRSSDFTQVDPWQKKLLRHVYRVICCSFVLIGLALPRRVTLGVFYGGARAGNLGGPLVKVKRLQQFFPEHRWRFGIVYALSNAPYLPKLALSALKARNIPVVLNQNGVFYPGWFGDGWEAQNRTMAEAYHQASYVFWQSEFCRRSADKFLGNRSGPGEVLYNAVDTSYFCPAANRSSQSFRFLVTGKIGKHLGYRLGSTIEGLARARKSGLDAKLIIAGWVEDLRGTQTWIEQCGLEDHVDLIGQYAQENAADIYRGADAYVITKYLDPCPNSVIEAMSSGLPILYSDSGGIRELVGSSAGIGLAVPEDWNEIHVPTCADIGYGMLKIAENAKNMGEEARARATAKFDIKAWIGRHSEIFDNLRRDL